MKVLVILVAVILAAQPASGGCESMSAPTRVCYDNTNAPPALVFRIFMHKLFSDSLKDEENRSGPKIVEAGLTPNMNADDVVQYFVSRYLEIEQEAEEAQKRTLCLDEKPRYEGAENFVIFNQLEEVSLNVYQKHLFLARSDLSASGLFDLDKALKEYPGSFMSWFMDHEKALDGSVPRIVEGARMLCANDWGHQFSSSQSVGQD